MSAPRPPGAAAEAARTSLGTRAARTLASTTKSAPTTQEMTPRWLLRVLPWVDVPGGTYRVNHRLRYALDAGRLSFASTGARVRVVPGGLAELPLLRGFADEAALAALADRFGQREFGPGEPIVRAGTPADALVLIAHGKARRVGVGEYGQPAVLGTLTGGDHLGDQMLAGRRGPWEYTVEAVTPCTVLVLTGRTYRALAGRLPGLGEHVAAAAAGAARPQNRYGEAALALAAGHTGEAELPGTFVDYDAAPREYELSLAQTVLRVHTRVADLYRGPMDQVEQQLRLTVAALRERQEAELVTNPGFGLLANADLRQRIPTRTGPPTPDDLDELLSRRRRSEYFLAHPRAIAAFGRECTRRGLYPAGATVQGSPVTAWRGVPILPCNKIPISRTGLTSILVLRTGEARQGVVGLRRTGLPDEHEPGLSVRFTGIDRKAIMSYLVTAYYSLAILVPDALGVLENVEIGR